MPWTVEQREQNHQMIWWRGSEISIFPSLQVHTDIDKDCLSAFKTKFHNVLPKQNTRFFDSYSTHLFLMISFQVLARTCKIVDRLLSVAAPAGISTTLWRHLANKLITTNLLSYLCKLLLSTNLVNVHDMSVIVVDSVIHWHCQ